MCQLPVQALGEGDVTERVVAWPPHPHLWPGCGTGTHLLVLCVDPSSMSVSPAEIPSLFDVYDSMTFCVFGHQSHIPKAESPHVLDVTVCH